MGVCNLRWQSALRVRLGGFCGDEVSALDVFRLDRFYWRSSRPPAPRVREKELLCLIGMNEKLSADSSKKEAYSSPFAHVQSFVSGELAHGAPSVPRRDRGAYWRFQKTAISTCAQLCLSGQLAFVCSHHDQVNMIRDSLERGECTCTSHSTY